MSNTVVRPQGDTYETTDILMGKALMMAGYSQGCGLQSILPGKDDQLVFMFDLDTVWETVESILLGKELTFTYANYWKAEMTWQMNLRHFSKIRRGRV